MFGSRRCLMKPPLGKVSPCHPIMIIKGNNIAGEVACQEAPRGCSRVPLRGWHRKSNQVHRTGPPRDAPCPTATGCYQYIILKCCSRRAEVDTDTVKQSTRYTYARVRGLHLHIDITMRPVR
jgi:hypothetical protein